MSDIPACTTIIRRRFIPDEITLLNKDTIHELTDTRILTSWHSLKPRADIAGGVSAYYPDLGFKISRIYDHDHQLVYWYCDIINMSCDPERLYYEDMLLDVILLPDGSLQILDADELASALEQGLITQEFACTALRRLNDLLTRIYAGTFSELQEPVCALEKKLYQD